MRSFVVFQAVDEAGLECLVGWRRSRSFQSAEFVRTRFELAYHVSLPHPWQTKLPIERDMIAISVATGEVLALDGWDCQRLGHIYEILGFRHLAGLDPAGEAIPLYIEPNDRILGLMALMQVMPQEVVKTTYADGKTLPVFLTPKSLVKLAIQGMIILGMTYRDAKTGAIDDRAEARSLGNLFSSITPIPGEASVTTAPDRP